MAARKKQYRGIDIEAALCVDLGHKWTEVFFGHAQGNGRTALPGIPVRIAVCDTCHSQKLEYVAWDGHIVSRRYSPDHAYITNARALSDSFYDRRRALREAKTERFKREGDRGKT
jgi:hypothetical protein